MKGYYKSGKIVIRGVTSASRPVSPRESKLGETSEATENHYYTAPKKDETFMGRPEYRLRDSDIDVS